MKIFSGKNDSLTSELAWKLKALCFIFYEIFIICHPRDQKSAPTPSLPRCTEQAPEKARDTSGVTQFSGALPNLEPDSLWQLAILLLLFLHAVSSLDAVTKHTPQEKGGQVAEALKETIWLDVSGCVDGCGSSNTQYNQTAQLKLKFLLGSYRRKVVG